MKIISYFLLLLIIISLAFTLQYAYAQEEGDTEPNNSLSENSRALQFGIGENFRLTSFTGSAFSYKRHTAAIVQIELASALTIDLTDSVIQMRRIQQCIVRDLVWT